MNRTLTTILTILCFLLPISGFATKQIPESIVIDGQHCSLQKYPLYYCEEPLDSLLLNKYNDAFESECTCLWRNYIGFWSIENDRLYLDSIMIGCDGPIIKVEEEELFKDYLDNGKVWAKWMNDEIKVESGRLLINYDTYEHEDFYKLENGIVKSHRRVENKLLLTSNLAEKNKEAINKWNEFGNTLCDKFPTLKGKFLVRIKYTGCQQNGLPTKVEVELVKYDEGINTDKESLKSLREAISQYSLENIMSNIYEINGKIVSFPMTYPIMLTKEEQ